LDKLEYIEKAPEYYALGIVLGLLNFELTGTRAGTIRHLDVAFNPSASGKNFFMHEPLTKEAVNLLARLGCVEIIQDDFGPTAYGPSARLRKWFDHDPHDDLPLFKKYRGFHDVDWLAQALDGVNQTYFDLGVSDADFARELTETQWEPIPLDRGDEALISARGALDEAIRQIEQDNGYAVTVPGEREYVLDNLKRASTILKEQSLIYVMQLRAYVIEPLRLVIRRFGPAAVGLAANVAREAFKDWLKKNYLHLLDKFPWPWS
jgi:hypothetical protein